MSVSKANLAIRTAGTLFVFLLGIFIGITVPRQTSATPQPLTQSEAVERAPQIAATQSDGSSLLVTAGEKTCWVDRYTICGHEYISGRDEDVSELSRERLMLLYPEVFALDAATGESVMLERDVEGFCTHHVMLKLTDGKLCVYSFDEEAHKLRELAGIDVEVSMLPYQAIAELSEGVLFDDMAQVDAYLESMDS